jgi:two-component system, OmpR family, sensor histidine kinase MprB
MSFRRRITLVSAAAVAIAVVLASMLTYLLTSHQLRGQVDTQLSSRADSLRLVAHSPARNSRSALVNLIKSQDSSQSQAPSRGSSQTGGQSQDSSRAQAQGSAGAPGTGPLDDLQPRPGQVRGYQQLIDSAGHVLFRSSANVTLPVDAQTRELASGKSGRYFRDARVNGIHIRVLAEHIAPGRAVQVAQQLTEVDTLLRHLRLILALLDIGGIALAALLGRLVAGAAVWPLKRLTQATEHVTETQDLSERIETVSGEDELGRLAMSFNAMLDALERSMGALDESVHAQRQLVADASHELRTPVTSLRTNIEILQQQGQEMDPEEQQRLLSDVVEQTEELTLLMNDLIDLARGEQLRTDTEDTRLDLVVGEVVERMRRNVPATSFEVELEPTILAGVPARLERAVVNLIDNAIKYSPPGEPVEIRLHSKELTVRDHGHGISSEDLPHVFDRFYRGAEARGRPGSGLGLAIVRQVAGQHGGSVTAQSATGGGTLMRLWLPGAEAAEPEPQDSLSAKGSFPSRYSPV